MADPVKLIGLDFGTTTSSAVIALAHLRRTSIGRMEIDFQEQVFRSDLVFTPLLPDDRLDISRVELLLDAWLDTDHLPGIELFGGGALLTGLTAQKDNADTLVRLIRDRLGNTLVARADDPCLESWLAFMGNNAGISREHPGSFILNLDIGGGTTNFALGRNRQVLRTGCMFVGARHVQVTPGTYRIVKLSRYARELFDHLRISKDIGDELAMAEVDSVVEFCVTLLEGVCTNRLDSVRTAIVNHLEQVRLELPMAIEINAFTFSGGVAELVYRFLEGDGWPATTQFGDLGIDLAQRIVQSPVWADSLRRLRPKSAGRATVYGLLRHTTEVSGSTLFLSGASLLPLTDIPIFGILLGSSTDMSLRDVITLARHSPCGGCIQVRLGSHSVSVVRDLGLRIMRILQESAFPATHPLVFLVEENLGKVFGQYLTRWNTSPLSIVVIDEVPLRDAQYVQIGSPRNQVVPVSYYGLAPNGELS